MSQVFSKPHNPVGVSLIALLGIIFIIRALVLFHYEINWDEFFYLSQIHDYRTGRLGLALQTFHVHFFTWLDLVSKNEAYQIVAARLVMLFLQGITSYMIYKCSRLHSSHNASLFAALAYTCFTFTLWQGASFRTDPIATCLLMIALFLILRKKGSLDIVFSGGLCALAVLVTIKSAIYFPILGLALLPPTLKNFKDKKYIQKTLIWSASLIGIAATLYLIHTAPLTEITKDSESTLREGYAKTILENEFFFGLQFFLLSLQKDLSLWGFVGFGFFMVIKKLYRDRNSSEIYLLALLFPVLTIIFYRNSYPYYYPFILAPASIYIAVSWDYFSRLDHKNILSVAPYIGILCCILNILLLTLNKLPEQKNHHQILLLSLVHDIFPTPVPYLDRCSMVSSFPKTGYFMSTWGLESYLGDNSKSLKKEIEDKKPVFMIANISQLDFSQTLETTTLQNNHELKETDEKAIRANYIPVWGPLYLAGKEFDFDQKNMNNPITFNIVIDGEYTLKSESSVMIDKIIISPNQPFYLSEGPHTIESSMAQKVRIVWGNNITFPTSPYPAQYVFRGF